MNKIKWLLFFVLLSILSYFRELIFLSINDLIADNQIHYKGHINVDFLSSYSKSSLIKLKYILTILFTLIFSLITVWGLKLSFNETKPSLIALFLYLLIFTLAFVFLSIGFFTDKFKTFYPLLRTFIDYLHNPIIYFLVSISNISMNFKSKKV